MPSCRGQGLSRTCKLFGWAWKGQRTLQELAACSHVLPLALLALAFLEGMLMMKLKDMKAGTFKGMSALDKKATPTTKPDYDACSSTQLLSQTLQSA